MLDMLVFKKPTTNGFCEPHVRPPEVATGKPLFICCEDSEGENGTRVR